MFKFKDVKYKSILDIKNLSIQENKITSILGESGSGKTTILKMLNKMISPDSGDIYFRDKNLKDFDAIELRRKVVMLSQNPIIYPGNIKENLLQGIIFSKKEIPTDAKLRNILGELSIFKSLEDDAKNLSGGEKQRIALGRIILMNPEVFLLDEPSSALDEKNAEKIINFLSDFVKENKKTMIMVTHSRKIAEEFSKNIIEIEKNKTIDSGENYENGN